MNPNIKPRPLYPCTCFKCGTEFDSCFRDSTICPSHMVVVYSERARRKRGQKEKNDCVCKQCGVSFKSIQESLYCSKHRHLNYYTKTVFLTDAEKKERRNAARRHPRPKKRGKITSAIILPVIPVPVVVVEERKEKYFYRVNAKTIMIFETKKRMERWKKRNQSN